MAIDFDALDLVRTKNKARLHEKKISDQILYKKMGLYPNRTTQTDH